MILELELQWSLEELQCLIICINLGEQSAPVIREYVGNIGSGMVEYGLPGLYVVGAVPIICHTVKSVGNALLKDQRD